RRECHHLFPAPQVGLISQVFPMKNVLFWVDGGTYSVLDPLVAEGVIPNLGEFRRRGGPTTPQSTPLPLPPQPSTPPALGRGAGHHGIHDFVRPVDSTRSLYYRLNDSRDNHCETIWKYASRYGKSVTVLNYFGVAPPEPINGHSIPAFVAARHLRRSSYPPDLIGRLQAGLADFAVKALGMDVAYEMKALHDMERDRWCSWIRHHIDHERAWFAVLEYLMDNDPSDLTAIVFDGVDRLQHLAYRYLDPAFMPEEPTPWESEVIAACRDYFSQID